MSAASEPARRPPSVLIAAGLVVAALLGSAIGAATYPPSLDEAFVYALTQHGLSGVYDGWVRDPQALLPQLVAYPFGVVAKAMWWMRLPSMLAFAGAVLATWWAVRHRLGEGVAAGGALLLALSPIGFGAATDARWPALALLTVTLSWGCLLRALDRRGRWWWVAYAAALLAGVWCNALVLMMVPAHLLAVALAGRRRLVPWVASLAAVGAGTVPLALAVRASDAPNPLVRVGKPAVSEIPGFLAVLIGPGSPERIRQLAVVVALAVVAAGLVTLRGRLRSPDAGHAAVLIAWAAVPVVLAFIVSQGSNSIWLTRYVLPTMPGAFLLIAWSIGRLPRRAAVAGGVALVAGLAAMTAYAVVHQDAEQTDDWARLMARVHDPGEPAVFYEAEGVQAAGYFDREFATDAGDPIVPGWDRTPVPADIVLLDNPTFHRLPPGPPDATLVRRLLAVKGEVVMAIRPADPEPGGVAWARRKCEVTRKDFAPMAVFTISRCVDR